MIIQIEKSRFKKSVYFSTWKTLVYSIIIELKFWIKFESPDYYSNEWIMDTPDISIWWKSQGESSSSKENTCQCNLHRHFLTSGAAVFRKALKLLQMGICREFSQLSFFFFFLLLLSAYIRTTLLLRYTNSTASWNNLGYPPLRPFFLFFFFN